MAAETLAYSPYVTSNSEEILASFCLIDDETERENVCAKTPGVEGGFVLISDAETKGVHGIRLLPFQGRFAHTRSRSVLQAYKISTKLKKDIRNFVEKMFFWHPEGPQSFGI
jgi:hypothetical protein